MLQKDSEAILGWPHQAHQEHPLEEHVPQIQGLQATKKKSTKHQGPGGQIPAPVFGQKNRDFPKILRHTDNPHELLLTDRPEFQAFQLRLKEIPLQPIFLSNVKIPDLQNRILPTKANLDLLSRGALPGLLPRK